MNQHRQTDLAHGVELGRYSLQERIATGGTADVWLAHVSGPGGFRKKVVVKILREQLASNPTLVAMFIHEARLAAQLNHPHIVQVFDFGRIAGRHFLAMEFVAGATLREIHRALVRKRILMPVPLVISTLADVCEALGYAYDLRDDDGNELRVVHRDISPENIMLTVAGATKVLDFGIAKANTGADATEAGVVKGKYAYMAPEQIRSEATDGRSDLYAVGVVAFELLTGIRPFRQKATIDLMHSVLHTPPPRLRERAPWVHPKIEEIVFRALAKDPADRFQTAAEMSDALDWVLRKHEGTPSRGAIAGLFQQVFVAAGADSHRPARPAGVPIERPAAPAAQKQIPRPASAPNPPRQLPEPANRDGGACPPSSVTVAEDSIIELSQEELSSVYDNGITAANSMQKHYVPPQSVGLHYCSLSDDKLTFEAINSGWTDEGDGKGRKDDFAWQLPQLVLTGEQVIHLPRPTSSAELGTEGTPTTPCPGPSTLGEAPTSAQEQFADLDPFATAREQGRQASKARVHTPLPPSEPSAAFETPAHPENLDPGLESDEQRTERSGSGWDAALQGRRVLTRGDVAKLFDGEPKEVPSPTIQELPSDRVKPSDDHRRSGWDLVLESRGRAANPREPSGDLAGRWTPTADKPSSEHPTRPAETIKQAAVAFTEGLSWYRAGSYENARIAWERACELAPENRSYASSLRRLRQMLENYNKP